MNEWSNDTIYTLITVGVFFGFLIFIALICWVLIPKRSNKNKKPNIEKISNLTTIINEILKIISSILNKQIDYWKKIEYQKLEKTDEDDFKSKRELQKEFESELENEIEDIRLFWKLLTKKQRKKINTVIYNKQPIFVYLIFHTMISEIEKSSIISISFLSELQKITFFTFKR